ncbi:hypothetical protein GCM10008916_08030 [Clostridium nitritogenes]|uniref:Uncharacterized protein n=1 Tax=Clostridium nitritogenes TaxID=83340 RepID=A0ABN1LKB7_9CLOT
MISKETLDKRICDCEEYALSTQTYREFIRTSEDLFDIEYSDLDLMSDEELQNYLDFIDELYYK